MTEYRAILQAALKTARQCYIMEPTKEGKKEWFNLIKECLKELNDVNRMEKQCEQ